MTAADNSEALKPTVAAPRSPGKKVDSAIGWLTRNSWRLILVSAAAVVLFWVLGQIWSVLLPVLLGLLLSTVLWPPVRWLRKRMPNALAAAAVLLSFLAVLAAGLALLVPQIIADSGNIAEQANDGLESFREFLAGEPFNLGPDELGGFIDQGISKLQSSAETIAAGVVTWLGVVGSFVVTGVMVLILTFFFLKDGPNFLGWLRRWIGPKAGHHFGEVTTGIWDSLAGYMWSSAAVAAIDGVFIGLGLWILGVPFVIPLAVLTFVGGFIPIVGAFAAGGVSILVALVAQGPWIGLAVLGLVVVVQQIEGNVLSPMLLGNAVNLHPAVVLASITIGGSLFGITGAFLAVPATSVLAVITRYLREEALGLPHPTAGGSAAETKSPKRRKRSAA